MPAFALHICVLQRTSNTEVWWLFRISTILHAKVQQHSLSWFFKNNDMLIKCGLHRSKTIMYTLWKVISFMILNKILLQCHHAFNRITQLFTWNSYFLPEHHTSIWLFSSLLAKDHLFTGQVSLPCNTLLYTQLLYCLPFIINDTSVYPYCLNLFHPVQILATAALASPSTLNMSPK